MLFVQLIVLCISVAYTTCYLFYEKRMTAKITVPGDFERRIFVQNITKAVQEIKLSLHNKMVNNNKRRNLRIDLYGIFFPYGPDTNWRRYVQAITGHGINPYFDEFWRPYEPLIEESCHQPISFLQYFEDFLVVSFNPSFSDPPANARVCEAAKKQTIIIFSVEVGHVYLMYLDQHYKFIYYVDSAPYYSRFQMATTAQNIYQRFKVAVPEYANVTQAEFTSSWDLIERRLQQQDRAAGCGFYALVNTKYVVQRIIPSFKDEDLDQMRHMLLLEIFRHKLFPILVDN
ncbi:hypothetical protein SNEBB_003501 [Seison nebaliae]|nr:hypothetical protein SNEBB_003501 [Seison nebaliae]